MTMTFNNEIIDIINKSKVVAICSHVKPDADCLGSASALKSALLKLDKEVDIFCDGEINDNFMFIPHMKDVNPSLKPYDLVIAVDCADISRVGHYCELFENNTNTLSIDHHFFGSDDKFTTHLVKYDCSSTAEILFHLIKALEIEIDSDIATGLYAGMVSDTGGFMHANTTAELHTVVGKIMHLVPNIVDVNYYLCKRRTMGQIQLMKMALNNMKFIYQDKVAITYLTLKDFHKTNTINNETFGIVDTCVNIDGIEMGILISEKSPSLYSVSFRGKNRNVAVIAEAFGGGGHKLAAGCNIFGTHATVIEKIEKVIKDNYDRIRQC